jgi:hypothetical protein
MGAEARVSQASQIQGTGALAVVGASVPVAANARARKAPTLAAAAPSRKSRRSGASGARAGSESSSWTGTDLIVICIQIALQMTGGNVICIGIWPGFCNPIWPKAALLMQC